MTEKVRKTHWYNKGQYARLIKVAKQKRYSITDLLMKFIEAGLKKEEK